MINTNQLTQNTIQDNAAMNAMNAMDNAPANLDSNTSTNVELLATTLARLGESLGEFKPYDSANVPAEIVGTRIVKCLYRADNKENKTSSYCRVPTAHLASDKILAASADLLDYVTDYLESVEDKQIKALHSKGQLNVFTNGLSIDSLIAYLDETNEGGRLNKDKIGAWFDAAFETPLMEVVAGKLGISLLDADEMQLLQVARVIKAYKTKFEVFASPKASIKTEDMTAMKKAIVLCGLDQDSLAIRFTARMDKIEMDSKDMLFAL